MRWLRRQDTDQQLIDAVAANFLLLSRAWSMRQPHATIPT
jgi:myo-inositol catabolism protein IolC